MKMGQKSLGVILVCLFLTGCSSSIDTSIDPITGMVKSFCVELKPDMEKADKDFWTLGKKTSMDTFLKSMLEVSQDANTIAIVSVEPAQSWLTQVGTNATDFIRYFSGDGSGGSEELLDIASRWKGTFLELPKYCD
jgi:hypothetical protein